ncbi:protein-tyrosine phosphatase [Terribacillus saccharophilus]|uniref:protein-tyrosine-phosphatase n=1 Tax=Terribacillus saccharophilus TaxID=361277 RepID=A0AAX2EK30_9BACI|nr:protein-tyrosine phosphatase [Terribacillus saccharophilus]
MINVLFISLGNICRSPMAEAIFRKRIDEAGLSGFVTVDSAGIGHWHEGKEMHPSARALLGQKGISMGNHTAKQVQAEHLEAYDYIIVMDQLNLQDLSAIAPAYTDRYQLFSDFIPERAGEDIEDPFFTDEFEAVFEMLEAGCVGLCETIKQQTQWKEPV